MSDSYFNIEGNEITEDDVIEMFDLYLDETYPKAAIAGVSIPASRVLKEADPIAYDQAKWEWLDGALTDEELFEEDPTAEEDECGGCENGECCGMCDCC